MTRPRTLGFGRSLVRLEEITSTIDYARDWLRQGAPHGAAVIAERQTKGRGRRGRAWASPKGGLWLSIITRPDIEPEKAGLLGLAVAVAAAEAIAAEAECEVGLKWPNDLMFEGRKVGGVLVDARIAAGRISDAILSIGVNVNLSLQDLPEGVRETATSLQQVVGRAQSLEGLAARLLENLEALWPSVLGDGTALTEGWRRRDALVGREVTVERAGKRLAGRAGGIDEMGRLQLVTAGGEHAISAGEVTSVRELHDEDPQVRIE